TLTCSSRAAGRCSNRRGGCRLDSAADHRIEQEVLVSPGASSDNVRNAASMSGRRAMRLYSLTFVALLIAPVAATAQANLGTYEDRVAVADVMARYVWTVDSLD